MSAPDPAADACAVTVVALARPERSGELRDLFLDFAGRAPGEPGCLDFRVHRQVDQPDTYVLYEVWRSEADLTAHLDRPYMREFMDRRMDLLVADLEAHVLSLQTPYPGPAA